MPDESDLMEVKPAFRGGLPGEALCLNKLRVAVNACIRKLGPMGPGAGDRKGTAVRLLATVFGNDGSVRLRVVTVANATLGTEITSDSQL
jgi:hypothetical protein